MALVQDPDFNIMQQSHGIFAITKLLVEHSSDVVGRKHKAERQSARPVTDPPSRSLFSYD